MARYTRLFLLLSVAVVGVLFAALRRFFIDHFEPGGAGSLLYGLLACLVAVVGSFFLLRKALSAPDRSFLITFTGGILGRFLLFAGAVAIASWIPALNWRAALIAILIAYFPLTGLELVCALRRRPAPGGEAAPPG